MKFEVETYKTYTTYDTEVYEIEAESPEDALRKAKKAVENDTLLTEWCVNSLEGEVIDSEWVDLDDWKVVK